MISRTRPTAAGDEGAAAGSGGGTPLVGGDQGAATGSGGGTSLPKRPPRPSWEFEEGDLLVEGRHILRRLGGGSLYEAYLVWDDHLFALAVAKVVRPDQADDPDKLRQVALEAEALARLAHPVVLRGFGAVLDPPHPHLLLEHLEGPTLRSLIHRHGALALEQLLPLALHIAAAIHFMAAEGMVHLDIKPDNIIMGVPPRLIDLSVARTVERAQRISGIIGTDAYMAPEQCDPAKYPGLIGPPADVWGLGATVFHALSGKVPFPRQREDRYSSDLEVRFPQLWDEPIPLPAKVPGELREVLLRTLSRDPANRPTAAEFVVGCEPVLSKLPSKMVLGKRGLTFR